MSVVHTFTGTYPRLHAARFTIWSATVGIGVTEAIGVLSTLQSPDSRVQPATRHMRIAEPDHWVALTVLLSHLVPVAGITQTHCFVLVALVKLKALPLPMHPVAVLVPVAVVLVVIVVPVIAVVPVVFVPVVPVLVAVVLVLAVVPVVLVPVVPVVPAVSAFPILAMIVSTMAVLVHGSAASSATRRASTIGSSRISSPICMRASVYAAACSMGGLLLAFDLIVLNIVFAS